MNYKSIDEKIAAKERKSIEKMHQNKMRHWDSTSYNILIGQAVNLWADHQNQSTDIRGWVDILLTARRDPKIRRLYEDYLNAEAREYERLEEAEKDIEAESKAELEEDKIIKV